MQVLQQDRRHKVLTVPAITICYNISPLTLCAATQYSKVIFQGDNTEGSYALLQHLKQANTAIFTEVKGIQRKYFLHSTTSIPTLCASVLKTSKHRVNS